MFIAKNFNHENFNMVFQIVNLYQHMPPHHQNFKSIHKLSIVDHICFSIYTFKTETLEGHLKLNK